MRFLQCFLLLLFVPGLGESQQSQELAPDEIIRRFSAKETEFYQAWMQYTYRQIAEVKIITVNGSHFIRF